jgi:uncharacterized phage protein (TIGR02218 family)
MSGVESLGQPLSTLAFCWRLERRDGVTIGLTSHDRDLYIAGLRYRAAPGMTPSAIRTDIGLEADALEIEGALTADAITAADLAAGRWDGAALTLWLTQWEAPGALWLALSRGTIGGVERGWRVCWMRRLRRLLRPSVGRGWATGTAVSIWPGGGRS